jgi:Niemann-Pick C1 protein
MLLIVFQAQSTACSCVDCEQSCPAPPPPLPPVIPFTFLGLSSITWWVLLTFVLGTAIFLLSVCCLGKGTSDTGKYRLTASALF